MAAEPVIPARRRRIPVWVLLVIIFVGVPLLGTGGFLFWLTSDADLRAVMEEANGVDDGGTRDDKGFPLYGPLPPSSK